MLQRLKFFIYFYFLFIFFYFYQKLIFAIVNRLDINRTFRPSLQTRNTKYPKHANMLLDKATSMLDIGEWEKRMRIKMILYCVINKNEFKILKGSLYSHIESFIPNIEKTIITSNKKIWYHM